MTVILPPLVDAYLVLEQPRQRLGHWSRALAALDSPSAPPLAAVTAYYDPTCDHALLGLRYDELALGAKKLAFVVEVALLAEIGMVQPAELSEGERKRFVTERLARCTVQIAGKRTAALALSGLVRKLREARQTHAPAPGGAPAVSPAASGPLKVVEVVEAAARSSSRRDDFRHVASLPAIRDTSGHTGERHVVAEVTDVEPPAMGKGTRDDIRDLATGTGPEPPAPPRTDYTRADRSEPSPVSRNVIARASSPRLAHSSDSLPRLDKPEVTVPASPAALAVPEPVVRPVETEPYLPLASRPAAPDIIYARYLRSGRWVPIRIGQLNLKSAALLTGALPRVHDHVDVALSFANQRALVRGTVSKVSSGAEAAASGTSTFSVAFELDEASRRQLTALLTAARAARITIKPPPPRSTRRFPVEWPIQLGTMRGAVRADALDISLGGLFVRPVAALMLDTTLNFSMVLEDGGAPIAGRGRVVRQITEVDARTRGLAGGFGLRLVDMGDTDHERWRNFLARVERRTACRVLIGASPVRLAELQAGLAAAGYAVTGGTDPGALVQLASTEARPVDAAVVDAGWLGHGASATWVESLFSARGVPCVTLHGDARRARAAIDKLLHVS